MQMRQWLYEQVNSRARAAECRRAAMELEAAGYPEMALLNLEMAEWLSPAPRAKPERVKGHRAHRTKGPDHTRVDGRRDAAPRAARRAA